MQSHSVKQSTLYKVGRDDMGTGGGASTKPPPKPGFFFGGGGGGFFFPAATAVMSTPEAVGGMEFGIVRGVALDVAGSAGPDPAKPPNLLERSYFWLRLLAVFIPAVT